MCSVVRKRWVALRFSGPSQPESHSTLFFILLLRGEIIIIMILLFFLFLPMMIKEMCVITTMEVREPASTQSRSKQINQSFVRSFLFVQTNLLGEDDYIDRDYNGGARLSTPIAFSQGLNKSINCFAGRQMISSSPQSRVVPYVSRASSSCHNL